MFSALARRTALLSTARSFSAVAPVSNITRIGVVGLGLMGHGIAQISAQNGYNVVAVEMKDEALDTGRTRITNSLDKIYAKKTRDADDATKQAAEAEKAQIMDRIQYSTDLSQLKDCDLVVEAIIEDINIKLPFWENMGKIVKPEAIFASNTSSLAITEMANASNRADRFVGLHFFNPVQLMKLVEIVQVQDTKPEIMDMMRDWVTNVKKVPVTCKDTPGFIVNRLLVPAMAQAMLMLDREDASVADIDTSMKLGAGHPMGPLTLADYVGLDTCLSILEGWKVNFPDEPAFAVPECLKAKVAAGQFGRKSGSGFFKWDGDKPVGVNA